MEPRALNPGREWSRGGNKPKDCRAESQSWVIRATVSRDRPRIYPKGLGEETGQKLRASGHGKSVWNGEQEGDRSWRGSLSTRALPQALADRGRKHEGY